MTLYMALSAAPTPSLMDQYNNEEYLQCNAILASTIDIVDEINDFVLSLVPGSNLFIIFYA